jgi:hypothetical protein
MSQFVKVLKIEKFGKQKNYFLLSLECGHKIERYKPRGAPQKVICEECQLEKYRKLGAKNAG